MKRPLYFLNNVRPAVLKKSIVVKLLKENG